MKFTSALSILILAGSQGFAPVCAQAVRAREVDPPTRVAAAGRIVAIGDLHCNSAAAMEALKLAGAVNRNGEWIGGNLVIVQTGDQLHCRQKRLPAEDKSLLEEELLIGLHRLGEEAAAAGGALYVLNGNHEMERMLGNEPGPKFAGILGNRNSVMEINGNVFVHGGVTSSQFGLKGDPKKGIDAEQIAENWAKIEAWNQDIRSWIRGGRQPRMVEKRMRSNGSNPAAAENRSPVWARRYCRDVSKSDCKVLEKTLARLGAQRMIVGHTPHIDGIESYCEEKVWCIDGAMWAGAAVQVLEIDGDIVSRLP